MFIFKNKHYTNACEALDDYIREFELNQQHPSQQYGRHKTNSRDSSESDYTTLTSLKSDLATTANALTTVTLDDGLVTTADSLVQHVEKLENMINFLSLRINKQKNENNLLEETITQTDSTTVPRHHHKQQQQQQQQHVQFNDNDPLVESLTMFEKLNKQLQQHQKRQHRHEEAEEAGHMHRKQSVDSLSSAASSNIDWLMSNNKEDDDGDTNTLTVTATANGTSNYYSSNGNHKYSTSNNISRTITGSGSGFFSRTSSSPIPTAVPPNNSSSLDTLLNDIKTVLK